MPAWRLFIVSLVILPVEVAGQTRLIRKIGEESGLVPPVWAVGQDSDGFLWIGTEGGLLMHDGVRPRAPADGRIQGAVVSLDFAAHGRVAAVNDRGDLYEIRRGTVRRLAPPGEAGPRTLRIAAYDGAGRLWTIRGASLVVRSLEEGGANDAARVEADSGPEVVPRESWHTFDPALLGGERPHLIRRDARGAIIVATDRGVWRVTARGGALKVSDAGRAADVLGLEDRVLILHGRGVLEAGSAGERALWAPDAANGVAGARPVALARRGATLWVSYDRFLVSVRPDRGVEVLSSADGIDAGGPLLVDREGSLWMGSFTALLQLPEPDTRLWSEPHGLPSRHVRFLARTGRTIWVSGWQGVGRIDTGPGAVHAVPVSDWFSQERICDDPAAGVAWMSSRRGLLEVGASGVRRTHASDGRILGCARARSGGVWIAGSTGILRIRGEGAAPEVVDAPSSSTGAWEAVLEDGHGVLWAAREGRICRRHLEGTGGWSCTDIGPTGKVTGLVELPTGGLWASTMRAGVLELRRDGTWTALAASRELPTTAIFGLVPARAGGTWVVGHGVVQRVIGRDGGWQVVERLGAWNGLPVTGGEDLLEDEDGTVWITTSLGVVQMPPSARFATADPPPVAVTEAVIDGAAVGAAAAFDVPYRHNRLELRFAALSYRDPRLLRYQVRFADRGEWHDAPGSPAFHWLDLRPGRYRAQLRASLDGVQWSALPALVTFRVRAPWYLEPAALALFILLLAAAVFAIHQMRVRILLGLERQRTRIAMDLHDEIGSGLGSIGMLAGVLTTASSSPPGRRGGLAREIASTAEQLGESLSDIVWSLDPSPATLHDLGVRLAEHGNRLFAAEDGPDFVVELPAERPRARLPLAVRRNVLAIGLEALHNAARHARASQVRLRLEATGDHWRLIVQDDGRGWSADAGAAAPSLGGRGLAGMGSRARDIGASLVVASEPGRGTRIELVFGARG